MSNWQTDPEVAAFRTADAALAALDDAFSGFREDSRPAAVVRILAKCVQDIDGMLDDLVIILRATDYASWQELADDLGVTRQAVHKRYTQKVNEARREIASRQNSAGPTTDPRGE